MFVGGFIAVRCFGAAAPLHDVDDFIFGEAGHIVFAVFICDRADGGGGEFGFVGFTGVERREFFRRGVR